MSSFTAKRWWAVNAVFAAAAVLIGCQANDTWHSRAGWNARYYFADDRTVELCKAIERKDLSLVRSLVEKGANVNDRGVDNMTPLLWAFPDENFECFELLLEHGADPNVCSASDFGTRGMLPAGFAVTHLSFYSRFSGHCRAVMKYGGDSNLVTAEKSAGDTPAHVVIRGYGADKVQRMQLLADHDADFDTVGRYGTPVASFAVASGQYRVAQEVLALGADPLATGSDGVLTVGHFLQQKLDVASSSASVPRELLELQTWLNRSFPGLLDMIAAERARWQASAARPEKRRVQMLEDAEQRRAVWEATKRNQKAHGDR